jgi:hypothetical protein
MITIRTDMQAQFGKAGPLAAEFKRSSADLAAQMGLLDRHWRVLTDLSGQFDTVVRMQGLIVTGRNEFWTIEAEG